MTQNNNCNKTSLKLLYFNHVRNVGDECSPAIVEKISNQEVVRAYNMNEEHLIGLGSILTFANCNSYIWGTGLIQAEYTGSANNPDRFSALRGKLTYNFINKNAVKLNDIPLGDPGYLMPSLFGIVRDSEPKYKLGIVPHYVDKDLDIFKNLQNCEELIVIDVANGIDKFFSDIQKCSVIASTSLHGLVFAEALEIPNIWIKASNNLTGGNFKFNDWFSLCGHEQENPLIVANKIDSDDLVKRSMLHNCQIDKSALIESFPRKYIM